MNYLAACDRFVGDAPGGAYRIAWELACLMRDRGHRAALFCGSIEGDPAPGCAITDGIEVIRYRVPRSRAWDPRRWAKHLDAARRQAIESLGDVDWNVIHGYSLASTAAVLGAVRSAPRFLYTAPSPAVLEQRINWADGTLSGFAKRAIGLRIIKHAEAALLRAADVVHVLSRYTQRELISIHGEEIARRMIVLPWWTRSVPTPDRNTARRALGLPLDVKVFFTLRRLVRRMGLDVLVEAAGLLGSTEPFVLVVAGDGPERGPLRQLVERLGLGDNVRFLGRIADSEVALAYAACDAFVLPTRALECFGIIAIDALASGRPVIGTDVGAIPEILSPILPDWIVPTCDAPRLAAALRGVMDGTLRAPSQEALAAYAQDRFGTAKLAGLYRDMLEGTDGVA